MKSVVRDASLAPEGARKIEWAREHMPILAEIERQFERERPFEGLDLAMSIHLEAKTARAALLVNAG
ncbi:MAG: adenosylhomocysteinase, partial [Eubacteriales bacterium]|nr:adenosylhomocysteinase [Eubacteriales bacterium]